MLSISVRPQTYSHGLLVKTREFVLNIPGADLLKEMDMCGMVSGRDQDKFALTGLTPLPANQVKAPLIAECSVNIECRVSQIINMGLHDMFISEILAVHTDENVMDEKGRVNVGKVAPVAYAGSRYWAVTWATWVSPGGRRDNEKGRKGKRRGAVRKGGSPV